MLRLSPHAPARSLLNKVKAESMPTNRWLNISMGYKLTFAAAAFWSGLEQHPNVPLSRIICTGALYGVIGGLGSSSHRLFDVKAASGGQGDLYFAAPHVITNTVVFTASCVALACAGAAVRRWILN